LLRLSRLEADGRAFLAGVLRLLGVVAGDAACVRTALAMPMADFEDALQVAAAQAGGADLIVTRNTADYRRAPLPAVSPAELVTRLT
jgi:predicted nucleic acid-binding protein